VSSNRPQGHSDPPGANLAKAVSPLKRCRPSASGRGGAGGLVLQSGSGRDGRRDKRVRLRIQCMQRRQNGGGPSQHGRKLGAFRVKEGKEEQETAYVSAPHCCFCPNAHLATAISTSWKTWPWLKHAGTRELVADGPPNQIFCTWVCRRCSTKKSSSWYMHEGVDARRGKHGCVIVHRKHPYS